MKTLTGLLNSKIDMRTPLIELQKKKETGEKIEPGKEGPTPQVVNLNHALRASIDAEKKKAPAPSTRARRPAKEGSSMR